MGDSLLPKHGGYRNLKTFRLARLCYDLTVQFADQFVDRRSRTHDQMVQGARSGVQNIAEGSQVSGTSRKMELKLTNVARGSLEELRLDYEDFLRQRKLELWPSSHPALVRFKERRCSSLEEVLDWASEEGRLLGQTRTTTDPSNRESPCQSELLANGALSLLNLTCYLLDNQIRALAAKFESEGGFTERLYRTRSSRRESSE